MPPAVQRHIDFDHVFALQTAQNRSPIFRWPLFLDQDRKADRRGSVCSTKEISILTGIGRFSAAQNQTPILSRRFFIKIGQN